VVSTFDHPKKVAGHVHVNAPGDVILKVMCCPGVALTTVGAAFCASVYVNVGIADCEQSKFGVALEATLNTPEIS